MLKKTHFWSSLVSLGLLLGLAQITVAKTPPNTARLREVVGLDKQREQGMQRSQGGQNRAYPSSIETPPSEPTAQIRFRQIEQPQPLKVGIALGGVTLIGLELWWFLASKTKAQQE